MSVNHFHLKQSGRYPLGEKVEKIREDYLNDCEGGECTYF